MHPTLLEWDLFGLLKEPFTLHTYGLLIAVGFLIAMSLSKRQAIREGEDGEATVDLAFYVLLAGLLGARTVFIFTKLEDYLANPIEIVMFWRGGLVWYGGFMGAALYMVYYCRKQRQPYFKWVDIFIPYMALAHAFGRLGCLAAGCCFGRPTSLPWGIVFPIGSMAHQEHQNDGLIQFTDAALPVHPTQLYEAGAEMLMFVLLLAVRPYKRFHGQLFLLWLSLYPIIRTVIEMFRGDKERGVLVLSTSQYISIALGLVALSLVFYFRKKRLTHIQNA
jgi:phosphatidylglycerol:prolipoprotein diacylglycerol transferase